MTIAKYMQRYAYKYGKYKSCWATFAIAFPLMFIAAIRYDVGTDYFNYVNYHIPSVLYGYSAKGVDYIEHGYGLLIKICMFLADSEQLVFAATAFIIMILFVIYIKEWSVSWASSMALLVLCYAYNQSLNIMRQYVAISIFFFSLKFVKKKEVLNYMICIIVAGFMHKIAWIYVPIYFIYSLDLKKRKESLLCLIIAIGLFNKPIMNVIGVILEAIHMNTAYTKLIGTGEFSIVLLGINVFIFLLAWFTKKDDSIENRVMFNTQFIAVAISSLLGIIPYGTRILYMFMPIQVVYVPYILLQTRVREKKVLKLLVAMAYISFYIYYVQIKNFGNTLPYQTFFNK